MSDQQMPPLEQENSPEQRLPPGRNLTGCLVVVGIILTLPGICTLFVMVRGGLPALWFFALLTFPLAALGLALTLRALNRDPAPPGT